MGKYTTQELKNIYFEAKERFSYVEDEDIMGYENIVKKVERVLTGKTKFCKFNIFEKDTISAMFTENDNVCIINETYDEYVNRYGEYADLIIKLYGVKVKSKVEEEPEATAETAEEAEQEETKMKKYYFASGIRGIVGEHLGNIRGAKAKAQKLAEQLDEEITIFVRSNKEIDYSSINTGDGMWNIINDYCYYVDKVCPETAETVESVEETTVSETVEETADGKRGITMTIKELRKEFKRKLNSLNLLGLDGLADHYTAEWVAFEELYREGTVRNFSNDFLADANHYQRYMREYENLSILQTLDLHSISATKKVTRDMMAMFLEVDGWVYGRNSKYEKETVESVEVAEETTAPEAEQTAETAEQETELNAEVAQVEAEQTAEPETFSKSKSESESEPTDDSNTVETYQGNINVLIVADIANTFEMITHTGYFDTS